MIAEWESRKYTDREIWERYGMSENAFYDLIKRYSKEKEEGLKDKPSIPEKPFRKLEQNDIESIINKAIEEQERIKTHQSQIAHWFCNANKILLHILPKASPWLQAFIERAFRTVHEEFLNLVWIGNEDNLDYVLKNTKYGYNNRPNPAFNYQSPLDIMNAKKLILPQEVCGH